MWIVVPLISLVATAIIAWYKWETVEIWINNAESVYQFTEITRNLSFAAGAVLSLYILIPLTVWRALNLNKEVNTSKRSATDDRLKEGAKLLGNSDVSARRGGVIILEVLAKEHKDIYHVPVMDILCGFIRSHSSAQNSTDPQNDVDGEDKDGQKILERAAWAVGGCRKNLKTKERLSLEKDFILDLVGANLKKARLMYADFSKADLGNAVLQNADLSGAILKQANLFDSKIERAILIDADLKGANFQEAALNNAYLINANLEDAVLIEAKLIEVDLEGANLKNANLENANLQGAVLINAILEGAVLKKIHLNKAELKNAVLKDASLDGANLKDADLEGANLKGADLEGANLQNVVLKYTSLARANLKYANLEGADLQEAFLNNAHIEGANLEGTNLTRVVGLTQIMLNGVKPSAPPSALPGYLRWPFERADDGRWLPLNSD